MLHALQHPCIVALIGISIHPLCFALELAPLSSLNTVLSENARGTAVRRPTQLLRPTEPQAPPAWHRGRASGGLGKPTAHPTHGSCDHPLGVRPGTSPGPVTGQSLGEDGRGHAVESAKTRLCHGPGSC